ncbi:PVC-type heme-binding CxxCH protein [Planctomycetes bacterium K23_9]|uniref:Cytochrome c n=1 Tax=Stieleria marina TaxID=1930275 RepID=A0A517NPT9_9BACT|nr:Cytochrome c [Planctomycetes bacterium K23_9]
MLNNLSSLTLLTSLAFLLAPAVRADDFPQPVNTEPLSEETLLSPQEAADKFQLPEGFNVSVFAAEPDVQNPIAMSWDQKGRLWVAENYTYAQRSQRFRLDLRDRVVIFDNTTGDQFKKRTVFTDNVQMLTGIAVGKGGVWLMCPPKLIFIPDADGDDVPDGEGTVVLDGFTVAQANYHNFANGLKFGPDGWLYGRCGGSCPGRIGVPGTPDQNRLAMEGGIWRYHPVRKTVEVLTSGTTNPWGHDWNGVGEMFFCNTVNGHLWHMMPGAHFTRPFLLDPNRRTYKLIDFHADHWHFDTGQSWTKSRDGAANHLGGGHAHIGTMIYQGQNWPEQYRGKLFTLNQHGRRANQEILEREGSGYVAKHGKDMLLSGDIWFQGIDLDSGPDGSVFVLDWSDTGECHEHTGVHRTSGRIFKVSYADTSGDTVSDLSKLSFPEKASLLTHKNAWVRRQARLAVADIANEVSADTFLSKLSDHNATSTDRVQAAFAMHSLGKTNESFWLKQLDHSDEHVRAWAIRFLTDHWPIDDTHGPGWKTNTQLKDTTTSAQQLLPRLVQIASEDDSALVRLTLASTLQRLPVSMRADLAKPLVAHAEDADDHNLPMMIWYGLIPVAQGHAAELADVAAVCQLPDTLRCISRCLAEEIEKQPAAINSLIASAAASSDLAHQTNVLNGINVGLQGWARAPKPAAWDQMAKLDTAELSQYIRQLSVVFGDGRALDDLKAIALGKTDADDSLRLDALRTLIQSNPADLRDICEKLLTDNRMNVTAAQGLAKFDDPAIGDALVARYGKFRAPFRPQVISILSSRKSFATSLLTAIKKGRIPRDDLSAYQVRQINSFADKELSSLVRNVWGEVRETSAEKQQTINQIKTTLTRTVLDGADRSNGRRLFAKSCQTCHLLYGEGGKVGPDLTGSNRDNMDYLLSNIVDPSGVVDKDFRMTILMLDDGRVISGMVTDETDRTIKIQTATEALTLSKDAIEQRKITDKSPMPEGMLDNLTANQIRDLISYLAHPSQVPLSVD